MDWIKFFHLATAINRDEAKTRLEAAAKKSLSPDFGIFLLVSVVASSFGLLLNSWPLIAVGIFLSPPLLVFLFLPFGLAKFDWPMALKSLGTIFVIILSSALLGFLTGFIFHPVGIYPTAILNFYPTVGALVAVVLVSALAVFGWLKGLINGKVISVIFQLILILPLLAAMVGLNATDWFLALAALQLFIINFALIILVPFLVIYFFLYAKNQETQGF